MHKAQENKENWQEKYGNGGRTLLLKHLLFGMHMRMGKNYLSKRKSFRTHTHTFVQRERRKRFRDGDWQILLWQQFYSELH